MDQTINIYMNNIKLKKVMMRMLKKKYYKKLLIGLTPELHEIVLRRAERRGLSACAYIRMLIIKDMDEGGIR